MLTMSLCQYILPMNGFWHKVGSKWNKHFQNELILVYELCFAYWKKISPPPFFVEKTNE